MFPHPCGSDLALAVALGDAPSDVVPDDFFVVRGGLKPIPDAGTAFSASAGPTLEAAGCAVPHGNFRAALAGTIRRAGGSVVWEPETTPHGTMNLQHVNVTENGPTVFSDTQLNPVSRKQRIDEGK